MNRPSSSIVWLIVALSFGVFGVVEAAPLELASPSGEIVLRFDLRAFGSDKDCASYRVDFAGREVIAASRLGLDIEGGALGNNLGVVRQTASHHDSTWKPVWGERSTVRDHYNQLVIELRETVASGRMLTLTFRAYDAGVAFCYTVPKQAGIATVRVERERSEFRFGADHAAWVTYSGQGRYQRVPLSAVRRGCERPLVVEAADDLYAAVAEAKLVDYARMKLAPLGGGVHAVVSHLDGKVTSPAPLTTPWRVVMAARTPGRLLENNDIVLNLNDPCAIEDPSWIRPGKVIREVTLTTVGGKACVDFAVKYGLQYVEYDAGWYGHEYDGASDATTIAVDPRRSPGPLDLQEVVRYARERGIGIIVYVNRRALEKQLDDLLPLYREWGIAGFKFGFVRVGSQEWTSWLHESIRKCAKYRFVVDVHDEYRPTGYSRTYPNLMTVEGIAGDETKPTNETTLAYAFTRMIAGVADNTVCWTDGRVRQNSNHAYQLAKPVCMFSGLQFLFWYDRPASVWDTPELEFYRHLPAAWDDTRVIHGSIGEYAVIARRSGDEWFVGCMGDGKPRSFAVPLEFLDGKGRYTAHVYSHDPAVATPTKVKIERVAVDRATVLDVKLAPRSGQAVRIVPQAAKAE